MVEAVKPTKNNTVKKSKQDQFFTAAAQHVGQNYASIASDAWNTGENTIADLLNQRALPREPLDELTIQTLLNRMAVMDSNNFPGSAGVGEREGRIYSNLVR